MNPDAWTAVDGYLTDTLAEEDRVLAAVSETNAAAGLPPHGVTPTQGKMLMLLARLVGARNVLEIGTLDGYTARSGWRGGCLPTATS